MHRLLEKLLPGPVEVGDEIERSPGIFVGGAGLDNALVSYLKQNPNTPLKDMSFVIGIQGRGTLNIPGSEFLALTATSIAVIEYLAGLTPEEISGAAATQPE